MGLGVKFIEKRRQEYVRREAKQLFDSLTEAAVALTPANRYEIDVQWDRRLEVIDNMILKQVANMFREIGADLSIQRKDDNSVRAVLTPEANIPEETIVKLHWSRRPGEFVNKNTGQPVTLNTSLEIGPCFTGTVREWYETLVETLIDCSNQMRQKTDVVPNMLIVGPDACTILECSVLFKPTFSDYLSGENHNPHVGTLSNRFSVYIDNTLTDTIKLVAVKDNKRLVGEVKVLNMSIL